MIYLTSYVGMILLRIGRFGGAYGPLLLAMFLFAAFRYEVGCDWGGYLVQYEVYGSLTPAEAFEGREPLWSLLIIAQVALDLPYPWLNVASSALFFFGVHRLAIRQPDPLAFLILLFPVMVLNMPMSGIRQGAAIGLICLAFNAFNDRRTLRFVLFVVIASGIHSSAILFLLLAPLAGGGLDRRRLMLAAVLAIPGVIALLGSDAAETATTRYVNTGAEAYGAVYRVLMLILCAVPTLLFWGRSWRQKFPDEHRLVIIGSLGMMGLLVILPISSVIADRMTYYFIPIQAMIFARLPWTRLRQARAFTIAAPYLMLLVVLAGWALLSGHFQQCYVPYETWLFGTPER